MLDDLSVGDTVSYTRTFTHDDVETFASVSRDTGVHHQVPNEDGELLVHGLLTATLPTKIGGDLNYLARTISFEFRRPVHTGIEITCTLTVDALEEHDDRHLLESTFECTSPAGDVVLRGESTGVIMK